MQKRWHKKRDGINRDGLDGFLPQEGICRETGVRIPHLALGDIGARETSP